MSDSTSIDPEGGFAGGVAAAEKHAAEAKSGSGCCGSSAETSNSGCCGETSSRGGCCDEPAASSSGCCG